jgi:hypothetical protein
MSSDARSCPGCNQANRPDARFCDVCGTPLVLACVGCGAPVARAAAEPRAVRDYTPRHLVDKVLATRSAIELSRSVDPEVWHEILERFFAVLAEGVHRFEGTVNQYTG